MYLNVDDLIYEPDLAYYAARSMEDKLQLEQLFPEEVKGSLDLRLIKGSRRIPVIAHIHSFDAKTEEASHEETSYDVASMMLVKRQIPVSEEMIIRLDQTPNDSMLADIKREIYNDTDALIDSIKGKFEWMRARVLQFGKLEVNENGYKGTIDYGMPKENQVTADWSTEDADPLTDIFNWQEQVYEKTDVIPTRILTRRKILFSIIKNQNVRKQVLGSNSDRLLSLNELNTFNQAHGLPVIGTYEGQYRDELPSGKRIVKNYIDDDRLILLPPDTIGNTFYGPTAEAIELKRDPSYQIQQSDKITVTTYRTPDSPARFIKASATGIVTAPYIDEVVSAKITIAK